MRTICKLDNGSQARGCFLLRLRKARFLIPWVALSAHVLNLFLDVSKYSIDYSRPCDGTVCARIKTE
jgi:hypothetical protein